MDEVSSIPQNVFLKLRNTSESYVGVREEETEGVGAWPRQLGNWSKRVSHGNVYTVDDQSSVQYAVSPKLTNQVTTICA